MDIKEKVSLIGHNTFAISAMADWWVDYSSLDDLDRLARDEYFLQQPFLPIGAGSNLLFLGDFKGVILFSQFREIEILEETEDRVHLRVGSGVVWDDFVVWALKHGYFGIENLSWIPGTVGASAVQNIGAYGTEVAQFIACVETFDLAHRERREFSQEECSYSYRYSIFKEETYKYHIVTHVHFSLSKKPSVNLSYKALSDKLDGTKPLPKDVRQAVFEIRDSKLPDPKELPNAGSFFMNPVVDEDTFAKLQGLYPSIPHYPANDGIKLSAAWLLDQSGLKGYQQGNVATYIHQPLIIVNVGSATGQEIADFARELSHKVFQKFGVELHPEVRYIE